MPSLAQISCDSVATETERDTKRERITGLLNLLLHFSFLLRIKYVCIALEIRVACDLYFSPKVGNTFRSALTVYLR